MYIVAIFNLRVSQGLTGFPGCSDAKESAAVQKTQVQSLGWEDPLEKEMATHSSILAWEIPWTEQPGWLQSVGSQKNWTQFSDKIATTEIMLLKLNLQN